MAKRGNKHAKLAGCGYGSTDDFDGRCCRRKEWDAKGMTVGRHRCDVHDGKPCPFGKVG